jgi:flagellar assembly protein FliH
MKTLIDRTAMDGHNIDKYNFKVFSMGAGRSQEHEGSVLVDGAEKRPESTAEAEAETPESQGDASNAPGASRDVLVESLLKKADEMSSSVIKMQMKLEEAEALHKEQLEAECQKAFDEGVEAGRGQLLEEQKRTQQEGADQFTLSVKTLEARSAEFAEALEAVRTELVHAALDIAREVILLEVSDHSSQIAEKMASQLIAELQEASRITLRVNPTDHGVLSLAVGSLERVEIISDAAVSPGGVVAISNAGNIDAEVMKRFERVKSAALGG